MKNLHKYNESNSEVSEINQILNIARDEGAYVIYGGEIHSSITINLGEMDNNMEFLNMCKQIDNRIKDIGTFHDAVLHYQDDRGQQFHFFDVVSGSKSTPGRIKRIFSYSLESKLQMKR